MKHIILTLTLLLTLAGCFDFDARPEPSAVSNILGCQFHESRHVCVVEYTSVADTQPVSKTKRYECSIADIIEVYDGDTITDVPILVSAVNLETAAELGEAFPNIVLKRNSIYVENGLRIAGIDTPEMQVPTKNRDGTRRSDASRANEKKLVSRHATL